MIIVELANCTQVLLREIAGKQFTQRDIAKTYSMALGSSEPTDWKVVNHAILQRWKPSGLVRIKEWAWKGAPR